jgi:hypothetical protein
MSSSINPNSIDGNYPIAGQDNNSSGFRDNFTNIKQNLATAKDEITDLQSKVLLKTALADGTFANDMNYAQLTAPKLVKVVENIKDLSTVSGAVTVDWADAHFQLVATSGSITSLTLTGWPTSQVYTKFRLQITLGSSAHTVKLASGPTYKGIDGVQGATWDGTNWTITFPDVGPYLFEFSTYNAGGTVVVQDLLRNYDVSTALSDFTTLKVSSWANVTSTTSSSSTTTGALVVGGGVGIAGAAYIGGALSVTGTITGTLATASQTTITAVGNVTSLSSSGTIQTPNTVYGNTGVLTAGILGFTTGGGSTASQTSLKTEAVTIDKSTGKITMASAILNAATVVSFTLNSNKIAATDLILVQHVSGGTLGAYTVTATQGASGSTTVYVRNNTAGNLSEALVLRFVVIKSVDA